MGLRGGVREAQRRGDGHRAGPDLCGAPLPDVAPKVPAHRVGCGPEFAKPMFSEPRLPPGRVGPGHTRAAPPGRRLPRSLQREGSHQRTRPIHPSVWNRNSRKSGCSILPRETAAESITPVSPASTERVCLQHLGRVHRDALMWIHRVTSCSRLMNAAKRLVANYSSSTVVSQ